MSVHYKFKSSLDYDTITFDGLHISVNDFRKAVVQQKRLGKTNDFELQITNAQTKEEYQNDNDLIPKNTSLIISRIPQISKKSRDISSQPQNTPVVCHVPKFDSNTLDLSQMNASEEDKIQAMMAQSTVDYDPRGYQKIRGPGQTGEVPPTYRCYKCHQNGHWIKNCPLPHSSAKKSEIRRNTGIPKSFLHEKGAENEEIAEEIVIPEKQAEVPDELLCSICKDIFRDAVMIPCCGSSFCDDCVRTALLESEENECPDCKEKGTSPGSLIPNRFLRSSVNTFKNETGYERRRKNNGVHEIVSNAPETLKEETTPIIEKEKEKEKDEELKVETPEKSSLKEEEIPKQEDEALTPPKPSPKKEESLSPKKEEQKVLHSEDKEANQKEPPTEPSSPKRRVEVVMPQREILHNSDSHQRGEEPFKQNQSSYSNYGSSVPDLPHRSNTSDPYPARSDSYMRHPKHNQGIVAPNMGYCNNYGNRTERYYYPRDSYNINAAPYPYVQNPRCRQMAPHANIQPYYQGMAGPMETGIIEDPLEAFNRIMKEKEKRKEMKRLATERSERHRPTINKRGPRDPSPLVEKRIRHRVSPVNERRNRSPLRQEKPSSHRNIEREKTMRIHRNLYPGHNRSFSRSNSPPPQRRFSKSPMRRRSRSRSHPRSHSREMELLRHDNRHPKHILQQSHRIDHEKDMMRYNKRPQGRFSETRSLSEIGPKENRRHNSKMRENGNQMFDNYAPSSSRKMFFETEIPENRDVPYEFHHERRSKVSMGKFEEVPRSEKRSRENHDERRHSLHSPDEEPPKPELEKRNKERKKKKEKDEKTEKKSKKDKKDKRKRERHKDETKKHQDHKKSRRDTDSIANSNEKGGDEGRIRTSKKDNFKGSNDESMDEKAETFTPDININRHLDDDHIVENVQTEIRKEIKNPFKTEKSPVTYKIERCKQIMDNNGSELNTPTSFIDTTPENYAGKWDNFDFSMPNSEDVRGDNDRDFEYNSHLFQNSSPSLRNEQFGMNRHVSKKKDSHLRSHQHEERRPRHEETIKENRSELTIKSTSRKPSPMPSEAASSSSSKTPQSKKRRKKSKHKKEKSSKRSSSAESSKKSSSKHKKSRTEKKKKSKRNESR